ncbi:MAG: YjgP/YjgQ family permease [Saprospiraceae bacterium]|nr:YjgP/YjgQ family permease [Saprospiraceae bacterium]
MTMKIIDRLLIKSFIPPLIVTFFIAIFVLIMQFLWKWIDEIAGKGVGLFFILEMLGYMSISLIPLALPIAVLISSVMVMGNLSERYELSSFKSAGVSLARIMLPLMIFTAGISIFSYVCSDTLIPLSNLKYQSRLYDIKNQKPTLSLEETVFNDDFQGFAIRIGAKENDNKTIKEVLMYDETHNANGRFAQVASKSGEMFVTANQQFFVMKLYDGQQYIEPRTEFRDGKESYPFVRTKFKEWTKVFDLGEFSIDRTDETLFKGHHNMLTTHQLKDAIDSIDQQKELRILSTANELNSGLHFRRATEAFQRSVEIYEPPFEDEERTENKEISMDTLSTDSLTLAKLSKDSTLADTSSIVTAELSQTRLPSLAGSKKRYYNSATFKDSVGDIAQYAYFVELFKENDQRLLLSKAKSYISSAQQSISSTFRYMERTDDTRIKYVFQLHNKYSTAWLVSFFLFIGAPMGAIIRKGGFGYPLLVSVFFLYLILC